MVSVAIKHLQERDYAAVRVRAGYSQLRAHHSEMYTEKRRETLSNTSDLIRDLEALLCRSGWRLCCDSTASKCTDTVIITDEELDNIRDSYDDEYDDECR